MLLRFILEHIFSPKKDNLFCPLFVFHRGMSHDICDLILYVKSEGLNISWISRYSSILVLKSGINNAVFYLFLAGRHFIFLKCNRWIWDIGGKFRQKRIYLFWAFWSLIFKFFFKRGNHEDHPWSKRGWISALHNSLLNAGVRHLLSR